VLTGVTGVSSWLEARETVGTDRTAAFRVGTVAVGWLLSDATGAPVAPDGARVELVATTAGETSRPALLELPAVVSVLATFD